MHDVKGGNDAAATTPQDRVDAETARPSKLNEAQRDGLACITCGRDDQPMRPVEVRDGVQVFECSSHDEPLTADQLAGRACVTCGAQGQPMRVAGEVPGHGDVFECSSHGQPTARARTEAAMRSLKDIVAGDDSSVRPEFAAAVIAQVNAMHAEMDHLRAELSELGHKSKNLADDALKAFRWGWLAAWQLASELDMSAMDVARAALDEKTRAPFTADEQQRLMAVLFDIADDRQGFKAHQGSS
ncbi:hypothetical protein AB0L53_54860 [Nonomuraea sp. NPDC052129]|uniref:hypothetical protein n=1 Tax=Nonomuraea sp. NPDC052129 TaxID=3154651 RepID=UPI00341DDE3A